MVVKTVTKDLYEVLIVIRPNIDDESLENSILQVESAIKNYGGSVIKIDEPIRRKFTHKIKNFKEGYYVTFLFNSSRELPNNLKRTLSINDDVLRYIVVKVEK